jgi:hypothetical protein
VRGRAQRGAALGVDVALAGRAGDVGLAPERGRR